MPLPGTKGTGHQCSHFGTRVQGPIRIRPLQTQFRVRIFADLKLDPWFPDFMSGIRTNMEKPRTFSIFRFFSEDERICNFFESWFNCPRNSVIRTNCYLYCHLHLKRGINAQLRHWLATNVLITEDYLKRIPSWIFTLWHFYLTLTDFLWKKIPSSIKSLHAHVIAYNSIAVEFISSMAGVYEWWILFESKFTWKNISNRNRVNFELPSAVSHNFFPRIFIFTLFAWHIASTCVCSVNDMEIGMESYKTKPI